MKEELFMIFQFRKPMSHIIICIFLILFSFLVCACQPTPEKLSVVSAGDFQQAIAAPAAPFKAYEAPSSWHETLKMKGSDATVEIDATVNVPHVTAYPVYTVRQIDFDTARIKPIVAYFTEGRDVFYQTEPTKNELKAELVVAKANLAKAKADPSSDEGDILDMEDMVSLIEALILEAPESVEPVVITDWSPEKSPSGYFKEDDGEEVSISVSPTRFSYSRGATVTESILLLNDRPPIGDIAISADDAIAAAQKMLYELGIEYMTAVGLEKAERFQALGDAFAPSRNPLSKGYIIKFARNIDGIPGITNESVMSGDKDDFDYRAPLYPEDIEIYVGEDGKPQSFVWSYPIEIKQKANENVSLMPFEEIQQRIRDMLTFIHSFNCEQVKITKIELNMAIVNVKDRPDEAMYVPAWFIYYTETYEDPTAGNKERTQIFRLALNAIDGGRVLERPVAIP